MGIPIFRKLFYLDCGRILLIDVSTLCIEGKNTPGGGPIIKVFYSMNYGIIWQKLAYTPQNESHFPPITQNFLNLRPIKQFFRATGIPLEKFIH